eukprot:3154822-Lingulodinium_polyedra.AAC.1
MGGRLGPAQPASSGAASRWVAYPSAASSSASTTAAAMAVDSLALRKCGGPSLGAGATSRALSRAPFCVAHARYSNGGPFARSTLACNSHPRSPRRGAQG